MKDSLIAVAAGFCVGVGFGLAWQADPTQAPKPVSAIAEPCEVYTYDANGAMRAMPALTPP